MQQVLFWSFGLCPVRLRCYEPLTIFLLCSFASLRYAFGIPLFHLQSHSAFYRMPSLWKDLRLSTHVPLQLFVGMCLIVSFSLVLHKERTCDFHIIHIHCVWNWAFRSFPFLLGLSSLCLYYSTNFLFFNLECCIKQTKWNNAKCRSLSYTTKRCWHRKADVVC